MYCCQMGNWGEMGKCIYVPPEERQEEGTFILFLECQTPVHQNTCSIVVITSLFPFSLSANSVIGSKYLCGSIESIIWGN